MSIPMPLSARTPGDALVLCHIRSSQQRDEDGASALEAARLCLLHRIPMADSIMLAVARRHRATLWTQDADFAQIPGVRYLAKRE